MKFSRQEHIELYRIVMEIILNLGLLAWNILLFLLKYTDRHKLKRQWLEGMRKVKKGHDNLICKKLLSPCMATTSVKGSLMSVLKMANYWLRMHWVAPKYLVMWEKEKHVEDVLFWRKMGQVPSNTEAKGNGCQALYLCRNVRETLEWGPGQSLILHVEAGRT